MEIVIEGKQLKELLSIFKEIDDDIHNDKRLKDILLKKNKMSFSDTIDFYIENIELIKTLIEEKKQKKSQIETKTQTQKSMQFLFDFPYTITTKDFEDQVIDKYFYLADKTQSFKEYCDTKYRDSKSIKSIEINDNYCDWIINQNTIYIFHRELKTNEYKFFAEKIATFK